MRLILPLSRKKWEVEGEHRQAISIVVQLVLEKNTSYFTVSSYNLREMLFIFLYLLLAHLTLGAVVNLQA